MLVVGALVAAVLLPNVGPATSSDVRAAQGSVASRTQRGGEAAFRQIVQAGSTAPEQPGSRVAVEGSADRMNMTAFLFAPSLCGGAGWTEVTFEILSQEAGGALRCRSGRRDSQLARWENGNGRFAYLGDRGVWLASSEEAGPGLRFIRFEVDGASNADLTWIVAAPEVRRRREAEETRTTDGGGDLDR